MRGWGAMWGLVAMACVLASCGAPAPSGGGSTSCTAGQTASCACTGGHQGVQTCGSLGTYGACVGCPAGSCAPNCDGRSCGDDGCGGTCGSCGGTETCASGACILDPASRWVVTAANGTVTQRGPDGSTWDALGGAPDPLVCLTVAGARTCTASQADTFTPTWDHAFPAASAADLMAGVTVGLFDEDVASNDPICAQGNVTLTPDDFSIGAFSIRCAYGSVTFALSPQ